MLMKTYLLFLLITLCACEMRSTGKNEPSKASLTTMNYTIPNANTIKRLSQTQNSCWATVATMMWMWKKQKEISTKDLLQSLTNPTYVALFDADKGLDPGQKKDFLDNMSLKFEYSSSFTPDFLLSKLRSYGAIWVTTQEATDDDYAFVHARICIGIFGSGGVNDTFVKLIDPEGGTDVTESFAELIKKFQRAQGGIQIVHW